MFLIVTIAATVLFQHGTSGHESKKQTKDTGSQKNSQPFIQPHHDVWRFQTRRPRRGLRRDHSVGSQSAA